MIDVSHLTSRYCSFTTIAFGDVRKKVTKVLKSMRKRLKAENITTELILFYMYKLFYQKVFFKKRESKKILFIVGCQRSGTSLMTRLFFRDIRTKVYRESSILSSKDIYRLRLNPLPEVKSRLARDNAPLIILKPLVESQNILKLLDYFDSSYAVWLFRNYKDVVNSNLKMFGMRNGIKDLMPIANNDHSDWRSEKVSSITRSIIKRFYSEKMSPYDAAALFWLVRNRIFFDLQLLNNPKVLMCRYEDLVKNPIGVINEIYSKINFPLPKNEITKEVHDRSVKKGSEILISKEIENLCIETEKNLKMIYLKKR